MKNTRQGSQAQLTLEQKIVTCYRNDDHSKKTMLDYDNNYSGYNYDSVGCRSIFELKNEKYVGVPVKIFGYITGRMPIQPLVLFGNRHTITGLQITDLKGEQITTNEFEVDRYSHQLLSLTKTSKLFIFTGTILSIFSGSANEYIFYVKGIEEDATPLEQINFDSNEITNLNQKYKQAEQGGLRKYVKDLIVQNMGIKGLDKAKELNKALDFIILQSFSRGLSGDSRYSNKLHSLVIGSPAVGKKLLTKAAMILNPVSEELSSSTGKITPAGLVGNVVSTGSGSYSKPGYLSKASGGVICIQDFHEIARKSDNSINAILSKVMEDGEAIDSTSAKTTHQAVTSIHIDMNKFSQIQPGNKLTPYKDIKIPFNLISRFDFIIDIPPDNQRQIAVTLEMAKGKKTLGTNLNKSSKPGWERELQIFVAYALTYFREVDIKEKESKYISKRIKQIVEDQDLKDSLGEHLSSILTRLQITVEKLVKAIACSEQAPQVLKKHIDEAFSYIDYKINFLRSLDIASFQQSSSNTIPEQQVRENLILNHFGGKTVTAKEVKEKVAIETKKDISEKTIKRDLDKIDGVTRPKHGVYAIPIKKT